MQKWAGLGARRSLPAEGITGEPTLRWERLTEPRPVCRFDPGKGQIYLKKKKKEKENNQLRTALWGESIAWGKRIGMETELLQGLLMEWSESCSVVSNSLWPNGLYSPWNSPGQNTGGGSLSLLQGIFPTQGLNPGLLHCRQHTSGVFPFPPLTLESLAGNSR